jgi:hypothetical protein
MNRFLAAAVAAIAGGFVGALIATIATPQRQDASDAYLAANRAEVERMMFADLEKYGMDVYRLYLEISQAMPGNPGSDFAVDKAVRKLAVTYPDSNTRRLADAHMVYNAIRKRDMLQIEKYLEEAEQSGHKRLLMPNGYEIEPQLITAQYNYNFHIGRLEEAEKTLDYLAANFGGSFIFQPQGKALSVGDFIASQRKVLEILKRKESK